jgi:hypothetical protein
MKATPQLWSKAVMLGGFFSLLAYMTVWPYSIQSLMFAFPLLLPFIGAVLTLKLGLVLMTRTGLAMLRSFLAAAFLVALVIALVMVVFVHLIGDLAGNDVSFDRASLIGTLTLFLPWGLWAAWPAAVGLWVILRNDPALKRAC